MPLSELEALDSTDQSVVTVLEQLVDARLLLLSDGADGGSTVEIVHECLLEAWPTLGKWLDQDREDAAFLQLF